MAPTTVSESLHRVILTLDTHQGEQRLVPRDNRMGRQFGVTSALTGEGTNRREPVVACWVDFRVYVDFPDTMTSCASILDDWSESKHLAKETVVAASWDRCGNDARIYVESG